MKKITKKDLLSNTIFIITFIIIYLILTRNNHLFASNIDFKYQHYLIPEYFRTLFYNTHDLFPDFALNLGSGQNIYYLSYYGLYNPYILLSYLFPFIKMIDYLIIINCLIVIISTILFYYFLRKHKYNEKISFVTSFLFLVSGPLIFHAKRHIMFINYFPFLILGLFSIDYFYENKKSTPLILSIILIILSSYYFSIPSLIVLFLYYIYKYVKEENKITIKKLICKSIKLIQPFLIGILITSILLLPTAYTLLTGRSTSTKNISLFNLFTPSISKSLLYSPYSIGLTLISLISLIYFALRGKKEKKYLSITCLLITIFPIFNYILNGTLYINAKSLIPFIPLILILVASFLETSLKKINLKKQYFIVTYLIISSFIICIYTNSSDKLMTKNDINNKEYKTINKLINEITQKDQDFYRINTNLNEEKYINKIDNISTRKTTIYSSTSNQNYINTYNQLLNNPIPNRNKFMISPSPNPFSQIILGEKYIITKQNLTLGYKLIKTKNGINLYENTNSLPLGYATNHTISLDDLKKLTYPNNTIQLLTNIVINNKEKKNISTLNEQKINYIILEQDNLKIKKENDIININAKNNAHLKLKLDTNMDQKILFLSFQNKKLANKDLNITINETQNKLTNKNWKYFNNNITFHYTVENTNILDIKISKGNYQLNKFNTYIIDYDTIKDVNKNIYTFKINKKMTKGDKIQGKINITKDNSYFTISIPYDKGFKIYVNNKKIKYQKSGANFITFPIKKGTHQIKIIYEAPLKKISIYMSSIGILLFILKILKEKKQK